ncbi:MAG: N-acyl-D-amino-acid deacylase family protein, partial [Planctomycetota bacterium]
LFGLQEEPADVVLRGATLYDGTGRDGVPGDLAIRGDTLVAAGAWTGPARRVIDARGLVAAPGFIDLHSHSDSSIVAPETRDNLNFTTQGVTTIVTGNCGGGAVDAARLFEAIDREGAGTNVLHLLPHGAIRSRVLGAQRRAPTSEELDRMKALVEKGMEEGAWGLSTGLIYVPGTYATTDELVELVRIVARRGGLYASHIRDEAGGVLEAVAEAIEIGARTGAAVHISHLKCATREAWGKMAEVCARIEAARAEGRRVTADQYPYTASSTRLSAYTVPAWALEGGKLAERLEDPETGARLRREIAESLKRRDSADRLWIAHYAPDPRFNGKSIAQIAREEGRDPVEVVARILRAGDAQAIAFSMRDEDMLLAMKKDYVATASDGGARRPSAERPHPRNFGTFPRKVGRYAIEKREITLAFAVRSSTGLPADILGLKDRGYLRPGAKADVVVFDPAEFRDRATFEEPDRYATGVRWLFVNGVAVIDGGRPTGALPGRALRRNR